MVSSPIDWSFDGQGHTSSSQDGWLKNKFFSWSIPGIIFLLCRRFLASFPYQSTLTFFISSWSFCSVLTKLQRKWLINRKAAFNCPLYQFPESQDYPFSALSQVKEKVTKTHSHPSVALHIIKFLKSRPNGGEYLHFILRLKIWQGKSPPVSSAETGKRPKYYGIPWATAKCQQSCTCAADTVAVVSPCLNKARITSRPSV